MARHPAPGFTGPLRFAGHVCISLAAQIVYECTAAHADPGWSYVLDSLLVSFIAWFFVLSLSGIDDGADIYNQLRDQLGVFVEPSVIHSDIEIEGGDL